MSQQQLVRVRVGDREFNVGATYAESNDLTVLDEPTHLDDGTPRPETARGGRQLKPKTSVTEAAEKKTAAVIDSESAPTKKG